MSEPDPRHSRPSTRRRLGLALCSLGLFLTAGCGSITFGVSQRIDPRGGDLAVGKPSLAPTRYTQRIAPYVFFSDFDLKLEKGLLDQVTQSRDRISKQLHLPVSNTITQVYLFEDKERFAAYLRQNHGGLPDRRALFIAQERPLTGREDLLVFTYRTDRLVQDLRHELTHALLRSVLGNVPLWLDEGLAEYFELSPERDGFNGEHLRLLMRPATGVFRPDLARLEGLKDLRDMQPAEYREAWAWVHLMLHGKPEARKALLTYLHQLKDIPGPGPLTPRLTEVYPQLSEALLLHLASLDPESATLR